jgi:hypothetical protein
MTVPTSNPIFPGRYELAAAVVPTDAPAPCPGFVDANGNARVCSALWIGGGAGVVSIIDAAGGTTVISGVPSGTLLPIRCARVNFATTTATLIVALY